MEKRSGLVHEPEKTRTHLKTGFSKEKHQRVLQESEDVPENPPTFSLPINEVGISEKTLWIKLPQGLIPFKGEISVDLPGNYKGIHMSRMEQAISQLYLHPFADIAEYAVTLGDQILKGQRARKARIKLEGEIPQLLKTPVSLVNSTDSVLIHCTATLFKEKDGIEKSYCMGTGVYHITACPCTQVYNRKLFDDCTRSTAPYPTHSQRCITWIEVESIGIRPAFSQLYRCLSSCLHLSQDLLKRPDEAELVWLCHSNPQFAEDVVRMVAQQAGMAFREELHPDSVIRVRTTSYESIHRHNVTCRLETTLGQIIKAL